MINMSVNGSIIIVFIILVRSLFYHRVSKKIFSTALGNSLFFTSFSVLFSKYSKIFSCKICSRTKFKYFNKIYVQRCKCKLFFIVYPRLRVESIKNNLFICSPMFDLIRCNILFTKY